MRLAEDAGDKARREREGCERELRDLAAALSLKDREASEAARLLAEVQARGGGRRQGGQGVLGGGGRGLGRRALRQPPDLA